MASPTSTFRAPMRARSLNADPFAGANFGVENSLVGIGEPLRRTPHDLDESIFETIRQHGEKSGRMLQRFASFDSGILVWTRTADDEFRLGKVEGPWHYEHSDQALQFGICQVRAASWLPQKFDHSTAPQGVHATFSRGGRNFQRIRDGATEIASNRLWNELHD